MNLSLILIALTSYMIGSISGGIIIGKFKNIDIRAKGSKASGATNALRTMGIFFAFLVLIIDVYKGFFATSYIPSFFLENPCNKTKILAGIFSILGHIYPLYFKFKGGKGVGTALGTLFAFPSILSFVLTAFISWVIFLALTGFVGLSSILASLLIPISYFLYADHLINELLLYSLFIGLLVIFTHRENIIRMINRKENQFKKIMLLNLFKKND